VKYSHKKKNKDGSNKNQWDTVAKSKNLASNKCEICNKSFSRKDYLKVHIETVHEKKKRFECDICNKCFSYSCHLNHHTKSVHQKIKPHACELCNKRFTLLGNLTVHIKMVHVIYAEINFS
jgi:KRAB domain-containing zinc finger protein